MSARCGSCGAESPEGFSFCGRCGAPLAPARPATEERRIVTVLFCDLVGSTARAEAADPEDVHEVLATYHDAVRAEIERFEGTIEKFVGDAVMAVFGAPVAHEDDPQRAARAGLAILEAVRVINRDSGLDLAVRIGIETGEVLVAMGARPERGERFVAGDVVNTAARIQSAAPVGAIAVGPMLREATRSSFDHEQLPDVQLRGKAGVSRLWRLVGVAAPARGQPSTRFVGRRRELDVLLELGRLSRRGTARFVTVLGEPGVGKSRLVRELRSRLVEDGSPRWYRGRCLPYGEGITFWALGEVVKQHAGIAESDRATVAASKLSSAIARLAADRDRARWLSARLAPLVGLGEAGGARREESFTAWRTFLELSASATPAVIVFEDLHWADSAMLGFVEHMVAEIADVPLLFVATARPEMGDRIERWDGGRHTALQLGPLARRDTARLVAALLGQTVLDADVQEAMLDRAGGNPLFAEEFVRMLGDRTTSPEEIAAAAAEVSVPHSINALIAARLDALAQSDKELLQVASVIGRTFWLKALGDVAQTPPDDVASALASLERRELVRCTGTEVEFGSEYSFWHALIRDVAYSQLSRRERVRIHTEVARWVDAATAGRPTDGAELLAHHYGEALDLARAARLDVAHELIEPTIEATAFAGDRALVLDPESARRYYTKAHELCGPDHPRRAGLLSSRAEAAMRCGSLVEAEAAFAEAAEGLLAQGDRLGAAEALIGQEWAAWEIGGIQRTEGLVARAVDLVEGHSPHRIVADTYAAMGADHNVRGNPKEALYWIDRALKIAEAVGDQDILAEAFARRGSARMMMEDPGGLDDEKRSLEITLSPGGVGVHEVTTLFGNLTHEAPLVEDVESGLRYCLQGAEFCEQRGLIHDAEMLRGMSALPLFELGRWDEAEERIAALIAWTDKAGAIGYALGGRMRRALILLYRGDVAGAMSFDFLTPERNSPEMQARLPALARWAMIECARGRPQEARTLIEEVAEALDEGSWYYLYWDLPGVARTCAKVGDPELLASMIAGLRPRLKRHVLELDTARAVLAEARDDLAAAANLFGDLAVRWDDFGHVFECAQSLFGLGRTRARLAGSDGRGPLEEARAVFGSLKAAPLVVDVDVHLAAYPRSS